MTHHRYRVPHPEGCGAHSQPHKIKEFAHTPRARTFLPSPITKPRSNSDDNITAQAMARMTSIGWNFAAYVIAGLVLGWLIQKYWKPNWSPWPILIGLAVGLIGGSYRFIKEANAAEKK